MRRATTVSRYQILSHISYAANPDIALIQAAPWAFLKLTSPVLSFLLVVETDAAGVSEEAAWEGTFPAMPDNVGAIAMVDVVVDI